jgi:hypothetical protein
MSEEKAGPSVLSRRQLLLASGVLAVGTCFSGVNLRAVLAESQRLGKPLLTDAAFTERLASLRQSPVFRQEIEEMKRSLPAYLDGRYVLNNQQQTLIRQLASNQVVQLNANLDRALQQNLSIRLNTPRGECRTLRLEFQFTPRELVITALT